MMEKGRAVLLDRDGVLNELVYYEDGHVGSPISAKQLVVYPRAAESIRIIHDAGYKAIVISNQPGVARKQFSYAELLRMNGKIKRALAKGGESLDGEYYCLHHPNALINKYRVDCTCRKPKPGLILRAAKENNLNLKKSFFVGDALTDIQAGKRAGCKTVIIGQMTDLLNRMMKKRNAVPDFMISSLFEIGDLL
ncbi:MAG: HAD family hydrolase [Nitrososphaerota archaeon]|jgi:D-glycero-D-manno-heptose 1,7-bisphosphate phosphatase|nr:HAD family hydrolase [Nitrososphaerota archaeon]